jgi:hypothetical protein
MVKLIGAIAVFLLLQPGSASVSASDGAAAGYLPRRPPVATVPAVTVRGGDAGRRGELGEALARFRSAGLRLPDVEIVISDSEAACNGHLGLFERQYQPWRIRICSELPFVMTHELAHAWEAANLDEGDRIHYLEARGLESWSDPADPWAERGQEDAAFIIQQILMMPHAATSSPAWGERIAAYELLTIIARVGVLRPSAPLLYGLGF